MITTFDSFSFDFRLYLKQEMPYTINGNEQKSSIGNTRNIFSVEKNLISDLCLVRRNLLPPSSVC